MSTIKLRFPVLVQHVEVEGKAQYLLRPLFQQGPVVTQRRYERAMSQMVKTVRRVVRDIQINDETKDIFLWLMFFPDLEFKMVKMQMPSGKSFINGHFAVVKFECGGHQFGYLPIFHHFFLVEPDEKGNLDAFVAASSEVERLIRDRRNESGGVLDLDAFYSDAADFITEAAFSVSVVYDKFPFEDKGMGWFFSNFGGSAEFVGSVEMEKVGHDLNERYPHELQRAFGREEMLNRLYDVIYQGDRTPIVLVGPSGVGKTTLIHETVRKYMSQNEDKDSETLSKTWHLDPNRVIAGMSIVGHWQKRFEAILRFVESREYNRTNYTDKLLIDNAVALLRIGKSSQNSMTLSDVLKTYLEKRRFQCIVLATPDEWKWVQEKDRRFADLFQVIRVQEPNYPVAARMMLELRKVLEREHDCRITAAAVAQLFEIHRNYYRRRALPGSVAKMMRQLAVKHKYGEVDVLEAQSEFLQFSGLNETIFSTTAGLQADDLNAYLEERLVGQPDAVSSLADVVHMVKARLNNPNKPYSSFLLIGPTGVGKTQAAKVLCEYLLGGEEHLMRFDMNEYIDELAVSRLIGDEFNPEGQLTGKVRYNPFGVLLFDEIEKANPKIHDLLLQVLDDGRLTDSIGRTTDFTNTIIIMTSNVGAQETSSRLGYGSGWSDHEAVYRKSVESFFRPEFVNRIEKIVIFKPLELEHILGIARLQIKELLSRDGFVRRTTILNVDTKALDWVARRGFDARMGGRALKRQIERDLTTLSADQLIKTHIDKPILFSITLEGDHLVPSVEPLQFIEPLRDDWMPKLPTEPTQKRDFKGLLMDLEGLDRAMTRINPSSGKVISHQSDWSYFDLKNKIDELKESLKLVILGMGSSFIDSFNPILLRMKNAGQSEIFYRRDEVAVSGRPGKQLREDKLFIESALEELRQNYQHAPAQFDRIQSYYLQSFVELSFLKIRLKSLQSGRMEKLTMEIESVIKDAGRQELEYLLDNYTQLLDDLDIHYTQKGQRIEMEGYGLRELLTGEEGYHLFYRAHRTPHLMRVRISPSIHSKPLKVIRLYEIWQGVESNTSTLTDLRTGYTNFAAVNDSEMKLLLYAGLYTPPLGPHRS